MRERLLSSIRRHQLMRPGDRVAVAVSGGADSVALLRLLLEARAELGVVLGVVHFHHQIRGADAHADEQFVRQLADGFDLEFHRDSADTPAHACAHQLSLEAAARRLRYAFFDRLCADNTVQRVATAHTRDDQAETVLMRLLRGSGTKGLAGICPAVGEPPRIVRPLLEIPRAELRAWLEQLGQSWREDATNLDLGFTRNRLRHEIIPVLRQFNPALDESLGQTAEIARAEEDFWEQQVRWLLPKVARSSAGERQTSVQLPLLQAQPLALQRRLIRAIGQQDGLRLEFHHVEQVLALAHASGGAKVELPHGWEAVRRGQELSVQCRCQSKQEPKEYDLPLAVPGEVEIAGIKLRAALVSAESAVQADCALLDRTLAERLHVRNWRPGDRYWPAHTRDPKKLKELLQARHIERERKPSWPVVVSGEEIVWVPGFAAPERFRHRAGDSEALLLEQVPNGSGN